MTTTATWYGNAAFRIEDQRGKRIYLDPWLKGNPGCPITPADVTKADYIIVSHGDPGHYQDSVEIARGTGATYIAHYALCKYIEQAMLLPATQLVALSLAQQYRDNTLSVVMFSVPHPPLSSVPKTAAPREPNCLTLLNFAGLVIGHAGDALFDAASFAPLTNDVTLDLLCLPMSGDFEQSITHAAKMLRALRPRMAIPAYHYEPNPRKVWELRAAVDEDLAQRILSVSPGEPVFLSASDSY